MDTSTVIAILGLPAVYRAGQVAANVSTDCLKRVLGPVGDEAGKALAHPLREWNEKRVKLGMQTLEAAAKMLEDGGRQATAVPGRILFPLLQAASIEENDQLRKMWATLLANSADSERRADMLPSFVLILQALSPVEAVVLEAVYYDENKTDSKDFRIGYLPEPKDQPTARFNPDRMRIFAGPDKDSIKEVELPFKNFRVMTDNLGRLGLIEGVYTGTMYGETVSTRTYTPLRLSALGHHFIRECVLPPAAKSST